jgi:hypothetical protein
VFCSRCGNQYEGTPALCKSCGNALAGGVPSRIGVDLFKSARGIAAVLVISFCLVILVDVIAAVIDIQRIDLLGRVISGDSYTLEEVDASDNAFATVGTFQVIAFIGTAVVFLIWIYRVSKNLKPLGSQNQKYSPGWAIGWFFIPFANWVLPFLVTKEIWKASDPKAMDAESWRSTSVSPIVPAWWALYVVASIGGYIVVRIALGGGETATDLLNQTWAWVIADVLEIPAAVLAILVVWGITSRQDEKNRNLISSVPVSGQWSNVTYQG